MPNGYHAEFLFRVVIKALIGDHKTRVAIGIVFGLILIGSADYLATIFSGDPILASLPKFGWFSYMALGVALSFVGLLFKRRIVPENVSNIFDIIDEAHARGHLDKFRKIAAYDKIFERITEIIRPELFVDTAKLREITEKAVSAGRDRTSRE